MYMLSDTATRYSGLNLRYVAGQLKCFLFYFLFRIAAGEGQE
jgi:hypothetical protein